MKIAYIVNLFPTLSETFILNQITDLLDQGHEIDIYANSNPKREKVHEDIDSYQLMERTYYFNMPAQKVMRVVKALGLIVVNFHKAPLGILRFLKMFIIKKNLLLQVIFQKQYQNVILYYYLYQIRKGSCND